MFADGGDQNAFCGHLFSEVGSCLASIVDIPVSEKFIQALVNRRDRFLCEL
jgi:hypothetical protein